MTSDNKFILNLDDDDDNDNDDDNNNDDDDDDDDVGGLPNATSQYILANFWEITTYALLLCPVCIYHIFPLNSSIASVIKKAKTSLQF